MTCAQCGCVLDVDDSADFSSDSSGQFWEVYECVGCGAKMFVVGNENEPSRQWNRYGSAYDEV